MSSPAGGSRAAQVLMVALLLVCVAQVVYWMVDEQRYVEASHRARLHGLEAERRAAEALLDIGVPLVHLAPAFEHLAVVDRRVEIDPAELASLDDDRRSRLNRFRWEGSFFLLVLMSGVAIVTAALRQRSRLLRRQENFVAAVTHELKSPLASLRLSAETLQLRRPDEATAGRLSERMIRDVERLEEMVANILDTGRLAAGPLRLASEPFDLTRELEALVEHCEPTAREKQVALSLEAPGPLVSLGDRGAFYTVMRNVVSNAIKSVAAAGGGTVVVRATPDEGRARLEVIDDGLGFEAEEADRLFERFYRAGDELQRKTRGSGLGLFIAERLAQASGARIHASSAGPGTGATFTLLWPIDGGSAA